MTCPSHSEDGNEQIGDLTRLLQEADLGREEAMSTVLPRVYRELRSIAQTRMAGERKGHTLQATALVNEAYLRLVGNVELSWANRAQFYHAAAEAMRRILIEHARRRKRQKRGGDLKRQPLNLLDLAANQDSDEILAVDEAIRRLELEDPRAGSVVRMRFFAGLNVNETASALDLSRRTVLREWSYARAWLYEALKELGD